MDLLYPCFMAVIDLPFRRRRMRYRIDTRGKVCTTRHCSRCADCGCAQSMQRRHSWTSTGTTRLSSNLLNSCTCCVHEKPHVISKYNFRKRVLGYLFSNLSVMFVQILIILKMITAILLRRRKNIHYSLQDHCKMLHERNTSHYKKKRDTSYNSLI